MVSTRCCCRRPPAAPSSAAEAGSFRGGGRPLNLLRLRLRLWLSRLRFMLSNNMSEEPCGTYLVGTVGYPLNADALANF